MPFVKAQKKTPEDRIESTLDIVDERSIDVDLATKIVHTGDILLYGHSFQNKNPMTRWYKIIIAGGGKIQTERRLPLLHVGTVIKNPPKRIKDLYGIKPEDGNVFVTDSTSAHMAGARLLTLKAWCEFELLSPSDKVMLRTRKNTAKFDPPEELWDWLEAAHKIPYKALSTEVLFNGFFVSGAPQAMISAFSDIIMDELDDRTGDGPIGRLLQGVVGLVAQILFFSVWLIAIFIPTLIFSYIPFVLKGGLKDADSMKLNANHDGELFCSKMAAETLMHAGILARKPHASSWYMPKDYLPKDIGSHDNQFDDHLNAPFEYSSRLSNMVLTHHVVDATPKRKSFRQSIMARVKENSYEQNAYAYAKRS